MQKRSVKLHLYVGYINKRNDSTGKKVTYGEIFSSRDIFTARTLNCWQKTKTLKSPALFFLQSKSDQSGTSFLDVVPDLALRHTQRKGARHLCQSSSQVARINFLPSHTDHLEEEYRAKSSRPYFGKTPTEVSEGFVTVRP